MVEQGDIIQITGEDRLALVVSKNYYNESGKAILCPVYKQDFGTAFCLEIELDGEKAFVCCDSVKQIDVETRGYSKMGRLHLGKLIQVVNLIKAIVDYV